MFKKIIFILIFSIIPTTANAQENYDSVDWINFDWDKVIPDQYTINLASMYSDFFNSFKKETVTVNIKYSPGFSKSTSDILIKAYTNAAYNFGYNKINLYLIDENGVSWFNNLFATYSNINIKNYFLNCNVNIQKICAQADFVNRNNFYFYINSKHKEPIDRIHHIAHHEVAHSYAWDLRSSGNEYIDNCWIDEGLANAIGFASSSIFYESENRRNEFVLSIKNIFPNLNNKEEMILLFKSNQKNTKFCYDDAAGYSVGMLIIENLYISYKIKKVNDFIKDWGTQKNLSVSLEKHFKISEKEFYESSFSYIIDSYKKALT